MHIARTWRTDLWWDIFLGLLISVRDKEGILWEFLLPTFDSHQLLCCTVQQWRTLSCYSICIFCLICQSFLYCLYCRYIAQLVKYWNLIDIVSYNHRSVRRVGIKNKEWKMLGQQKIISAIIISIAIIIIIELVCCNAMCTVSMEDLLDFLLK